MKKILLSKGFYAIVDNEDYDKLIKFNTHWHTRTTKTNNYAVTNKNKTTVQMHRVILNFPKNCMVDHINGNGLDNRKCNLRVCTRSQNLMNSRKPSGNLSSKYKGVHKLKQRTKGHKKLWRAEIRLNKKAILIGSFETEFEAAVAYNIKAIELFGKFAKVNKI